MNDDTSLPYCAVCLGDDRLTRIGACLYCADCAATLAEGGAR